MILPPWIDEVLAALAGPAMVLDGRGRVACLNAEARDHFGEWVLGQSYVSVLRQPSLLGPVEDAFFDRKPGSARFVHSGSAVETEFDVRITPLSLSGPGGQGPVLLIFHDVSDAITGAAMRRDFVANVSHELKTPLTAVIGLVETLQGPARHDAAAQTRFLGVMAQELSRMNRLVADLLSLSRVEAQSRRRPRDVVDLSSLATEAVALLKPQADEAGAVIDEDLPSHAPVLGDRDQLMQVAINLLENAFKYGGSSVRIALRRIGREPLIQGPAWSLEVHDDGQGIAPEHVPASDGAVLPGRCRSEPGAGRDRTGAFDRQACGEPPPWAAPDRQPRGGGHHRHGRRSRGERIGRVLT